MQTRRSLPLLLLASAAIGLAPACTSKSEVVPPASLRAPVDPPLTLPSAVVDLTTDDGAKLASASWRYVDAKVESITAAVQGGPPASTYDVVPRAGSPEFDRAPWLPIVPGTLDARRGAGRVCFGWYRVSVTLPASVGDVPISGATVAFEITVDDYAEVWVDGALPRMIGQSGGSVVRGFNAPNRVVLTESAKPGDSFDIAVFAINGPISASPENRLWVKGATLDIHRPAAKSAERRWGRIVRNDPGLDRVVAADATIERVADGFQFTEGPVWSPDGVLLFSDPNANTIYRYDPLGSVSVFRAKSGYRGVDIGRYHQPGSNGLTFDREGRLTIDEHGNRRVTRIEKNGSVTVLADRFEGKRLNSPNDLVYKSDGALYFTDPPFGLPKTFEDPAKELPFSGVFRVGTDGAISLVAKDLEGPNGIAFSPDERFLYVDDWDTKKKVVMRYPVRADGSVGAGEVFFDMTNAPGAEALDGMKVDALGDLFVSGPGGVWILSPEGRHLGTIDVAELPANFAWGDDGKTLYMAARTGVYRVRLAVSGSGVAAPKPKQSVHAGVRP